MKKCFLFILLFIPFISVNASKEKVTLSKCVDGDTARFIIKGEDVKVRFLGINSPEIETNNKKGEEYGEEAKKYTCKKLKNANKIQIEYDSNSDKEDKYGRTLAYVFVDDKLLESMILKRGYATVKYVKENYKYYDELIDAEKYAKNKKLGLYSNKKKDADFEKDLASIIKKYAKKLFGNIFEEIFN